MRIENKKDESPVVGSAASDAVSRVSDVPSDLRWTLIICVKMWGQKSHRHIQVAFDLPERKDCPGPTPPHLFADAELPELLRV
jgi:hypothetical protein